MKTSQQRVIRVHEPEGVRTGLVVADGPRYLSVIWPDAAGMKIRKLKKDRALRVHELEDYPPARARKLMRGMCKRFGYSKAARKALRG